MKSLNNKTVLITGGGGGIGQGMARAFAAEGARILLTDVDPARLEEARLSLERECATVAACPLDVTRFDAWQAMVDEAPSRIGAIDILCNNAGIGCEMQELAHHDVGQWLRVIEVNLMGYFLGCRAVLPQLLARDTEGHIVNVASLSGLRANPAMSAYSASKHGVVGLSDALKAELAKTKVGITVVYPGMTRTNFIANSRAVLGAENDAAGDSSLDSTIAAMLSVAMDPNKLGARVVRAVREQEYQLMTHVGARQQIAAIFEERLAAFRENADPDYVDDVKALEAAVAANSR